MILFNNKKISWKNGITLDKLLKEVDPQSQYVVVKINDKLVSKPNFKSTMIDDNSNIVPIPMIAGG